MPSGGRRSTRSTSPSGARMDRFGAGGGRGTTATRSPSTGPSAKRVSIGDVSTLGKLVVSGPDVVEFLERLYPVPRRGHQARPLALRAPAQRARPRHGRRHDPARVGDPVRPELHVRWRRQRRDVDPRLDRRVGPPRPRHGPDDVPRRDQRHRAAREAAAGPCRARRPAPVPRRMSARRWPASRATSCACRSRARRPGSCTTRSTGPSSCGGRSWSSARDLGIRPHGLQALFALRLEKGHVIVGMDTELDTTPAPPRHGLGGPDGQAAVHRAGRAGADGQAPGPPTLLGFTMDGPAPGRGLADLVERRHRRARDGELGIARPGSDA